MKNLEDVLAFLLALLALWGVLSIAEIGLKNLRPETSYSRFNLIIMAVGDD